MSATTIPPAAPFDRRRRRADTPGGVGPGSRIHVHVDPAVKQAVKKKADQEGVSLSLYVERLLREVVHP